MGEFHRLGFSYLKIDFLSHGALEGAHYDPAVQTGIQAYNLGMKQIVDEAAGRMFLSLSIAPLFPSGYGHARRLSCDTKGHINGKEQSTEYMLNALTYGWWTNKDLYLLDPDHVVLGERGDQGARTLNEGNSRLLSAIISGGMVLDSSPVADDAQAQGLAKDVYNKSKWFQIASGGDAFRPVEGDTGNSAANAFVRTSGKDWYLAVFNYDEKSPATIQVPVARILPPHAKGELDAADSETGSVAVIAGGIVTVTLRPAESKLLTLTFRAQP
jgi:alpha-galactosidase